MNYTLYKLGHQHLRVGTNDQGYYTDLLPLTVHVHVFESKRYLQFLWNFTITNICHPNH